MSDKDPAKPSARRLTKRMLLNAPKAKLLVGIQNGREQARRREGVAAEDARKLVDKWASK
jgi:hypothetical protein